MNQYNEEKRKQLLDSLPLASEEEKNRFNSLTDAAVEACQRFDYEQIAGERLRARQIQGRMIAYAAPDSTYAVTKRLIEAAQQSIIIGIYDFTASYMKELLLQAMQRGVTVSLMLDLNGRQGERPIFNQLGSRGAETVAAPSCSGRGQRPHFEHAHEKIIVVDEEWVMIQSGNWSENSIPLNSGDGAVVGTWVSGNRDMGLAVQSPELAQFFIELIKSDMRLELGDVESLAGSAARKTFTEEEIFAEAPPQIPEPLFPSRTFPMSAPVSIQPVLTPDNYMDVVPDFLRSARRSILLEQQYIRAHQPTIKRLLDAIRDARRQNPNLDIRIIVAPRDEGVPQMFQELLQNYNLRRGENIRLLSGAHFEHCHNKLIIVDNEQVLIGSQNWSTTAVTINREASLLVKQSGVARYFTQIFEADWAMSDSGGEAEAEGSGITDRRLFTSRAFASGLVIPLSPGDYADV